MQKSDALPGKYWPNPSLKNRWRGCLALAAVLGGLPAAATALAGSPDPVLNLMLEKGIITQDEAAKAQSEVDAAQTNAVAQTPSASIWKVGAGIKNIELYGDLRLRFEDRREQDPGEGYIELQRYRYAARLGIRGNALDDFYYGFRLETSSNPRSSMVTLGTSSSGAPYSGPYGKSNNGVQVGQIYLGWRPESWFDLTVGKMPNPLFTSAMVWSPSISPEGLAENFQAKVGQMDFFATFAQFIYEDENPVAASSDLGILGGLSQKANNIGQFAWQGGVDYHITTNLSAKIAATFYEYYGQQPSSQVAGNGIVPYFGDAYVGEGSLQNGYSGWGAPASVNQYYNYDAYGYAVNQTGINNLQVVEVPFEFRFKVSRWDAMLFGDGAYNLQGNQRAAAASAGWAAYLKNQQPVSTAPGLPVKGQENKAYQVGLAIGSDGALGLVNGATAKRHSWELRSYWQHIEQYSLDPNLLDLDFNAGAENLEGIYAAAAYGLTENFIATFRYGYASRIDSQLGTGGTGTDIQQINPITQFSIFQVDLTLKF